MYRIVPSLASANPLCLDRELDRIREIGLVHLDIEDGVFLPNITFGLKTVRAACRYSDAYADAHLMTQHPMRFIPELLDIGVSQIVVHIEALAYPSETLDYIHERGAKAGLALNLKSDVRQLEPFLHKLDAVLLMTSEPDGFSQAFCPFAPERIRRARALLPAHIALWADGDIRADNYLSVVQAGADHLVMGRAVFTSEDPVKTVRAFERASFDATTQEGTQAQ